MDPFSLTVGIASVASLLGQTIKITRQYIHASRHSKEAAAELQKELTILEFNISRLDQLLKSPQCGSSHVQGTSVLISSTFACRDKLANLCHALDAACKRPLSSLRWPLNSKEHRETIQDLRAYAQCVQFSLNTDSFALLSKTATEVQEVLRSQLQAFQILESIEQRSSLAEHRLSAQAEAISDRFEADKRDEVLEWISNVNFEQKHHDIRTARVDDTGGWFLAQNQFQNWRDKFDEASQVLLCEGMQGSGKSILASLVVDHLRETSASSNSAIIHTYCNYREHDGQTSEKIIAGMLKQLASSSSVLPEAIATFHRAFESKKRRPVQQDFEQAFLNASLDYSAIYIVVDALDECETTQKKKLLDFLHQARKAEHVKVLITSRSYPEHVVDKFQPTQRLRIEAQEDDLKKYIVRAIEQSDNADVIDEPFKEMIVEKVCRAAQKMFLLAVLQIHAVLDGVSAGEMEDALEAMPESLHGAIEETLQRIERQQPSRKALGMQALMWISHACRPMLMSELADALAINLSTGTWNPRHRPIPKFILESCYGLATLDEESSLVRLAHYSVQEYFVLHQKRLFPAGEEAVAKTCLIALLHEASASGTCLDESAIQSYLASFPFYRYSCRNWGRHVRISADTGNVNPLALTFLRAQPHVARSYQFSQWDLGRKKVYWQPQEGDSCTGLHLACTFGLEQLAEELLGTAGITIDIMTAMGTTPLIKAAAGGHRGCVRMLMDRGADPSKENWYGPSLHCAAEAGAFCTIEELLLRGVDVDLKDSHGRTALDCATTSGHVGAMQMLLANGANVNASFDGSTPLWLAVSLEQPLEVIQILLEHNADMEIENEEGVRVLHEAAIKGSEETLSLLLNHGADIDSKDFLAFTALHWAAAKGYKSIVKILTERGAELDARSHDGLTPLYCAAEEGNLGSVQLLLKAGADPESRDDEGLTPVQAATKENHSEIVSCLLNFCDRTGKGASTEKALEPSPTDCKDESSTSSKS